MTTPSLADISELYLHETSDTIDKLSNPEDYSTTSLDDFLDHLRKAQEHDKRMKKIRESQAMLLRISSHSTPISKHEKLHQTSGPHQIGESLGSISESRNTDGMQIDSRKLYEVFERFLEEKLAKEAGEAPKKKPSNPITSCNVFETPLRKKFAVSELDSGDTSNGEEIEDTFDNDAKRFAPKSYKNGPPLPITTPPRSNGTELEGTDDTIAEEPQRHQRREDQYPSQNKNQSVSDICKPFEMPPKVELEDVDVDDLKLEAPSVTSEVIYKPSIAELKRELEQKTEMNQEQENEILYLRSQLEKLAISQYKERESPRNHNLKSETTALKSTSDEETQVLENEEIDKDVPGQDVTRSLVVESTQTEIAKRLVVESTQTEAKEIGVTEENVDASFRPYYRKLGLHKVDELSDVAKGNVIKNMMLSMLVTDFDHLDTMAPKIGEYLRMTLRFLDAVHEELYQCGEFRPLRYLRDYGVEDMAELEACLIGMRSKLDFRR